MQRLITRSQHPITKTQRLITAAERMDTMNNNEKPEKQRLQEERLKRTQDAIREHRRKLETDEEYRKKSEELQPFVEKLTVLAGDYDG